MICVSASVIIIEASFEYILLTLCKPFYFLFIKFLGGWDTLECRVFFEHMYVLGFLGFQQ